MSDIAGLLLAGGQSRRMGGGDKCLAPLHGRPLLAHVVERATPQAAPLLLSANGDPARFAACGLPVLADVVEGFAGPLAGILTGLEWLRDHRPDIALMASFATDTPHLPTDLVARLLAALRQERAEIAVAASGGRRHFAFALWPVGLAADLRRALVEEDLRKMGGYLARHRVAEASWPDQPADPFFNVNTPAELDSLQ